MEASPDFLIGIKHFRHCEKCIEEFRETVREYLRQIRKEKTD